ncbi:MAG: DEAD/DEAH box helicase [Bdellovibrionota bacterium]
MNSFTELNLSPELKLSIAELGFETPSPIQAEALPILLGEPTDFLGLAATGTGKTAAFAIPLLEKIDPKKRKLQALILCPTRELVLQTAGQIDLLGKHKGIRSVSIYGGASYGEQISGIRRGASVVVGTPGRLVDHLNRGTLNLDEVEVVVLDEADEMISMGFKEDLQTILSAAPIGMCNTWLFSATMGNEVRKVADTYLRNPKKVQVNSKAMLSGTVEQLYFRTSEGDKPEILCKLIDAAAEEVYGLVFCQTKTLVTELVRFLTERGYKVDCLHGDMDQRARERTMQAFRDKKVKLLICTDVASRGLDVNDITHVFNYSIPRELDNYVHRIGRTGRIGKAGIAMSLVTPSHRVLVGRIEQMTKSKMKEGKIPTRKEIAAKKISQILARFQEQDSFVRAIELMDPSWKAALAGMTNEEIAGRFLALSFPEVFAAREQADAIRQLRTPSMVVAPQGAEGEGNGAVIIKAPRRDFEPRREEGRFERRGPKREFRSEGPRRDFSPAGGPGFEKKPFKKDFNKDFKKDWKSKKPFGEHTGPQKREGGFAKKSESRWNKPLSRPKFAVIAR